MNLFINFQQNGINGLQNKLQTCKSVFSLLYIVHTCTPMVAKNLHVFNLWYACNADLPIKLCDLYCIVLHNIHVIFS